MNSSFLKLGHGPFDQFPDEILTKKRKAARRRGVLKVIVAVDASLRPVTGGQLGRDVELGGRDFNSGSILDQADLANEIVPHENEEGAVLAHGNDLAR